MKILITGAAGAIGSTLVKGMKDRHSLRGLDRRPIPDLEDTIQGDVFDFDTLLPTAVICLLKSAPLLLTLIVLGWRPSDSQDSHGGNGRAGA